MNYEIILGAKQHYKELIEVWEKSVRATHDFLSETDIQYYKPLILNQYFNNLRLFCIKSNERILGFIGLDDQLIQMLFIDPTARGLGLGKALISFAILTHHANSVDVNEQNEQAVGFYKHLGFEVKRRFEEDAAGKPYPILCMKLPPRL
jgi:putative acetyltransferase